MSATFALSDAESGAQACDPATRVTRSLLGYGIIAGPIYVVVGLVEGLTRRGFDLTRHDLSLLSNGSLGWIHIALFVATGLMCVAAAVGVARALGPGGNAWVPRMLAIYGVSLVAAGLLVADPMDGFPAGTPDGPPVLVTWHGAGHLASAGIGFIALVAACLLFARWFSRSGHRGWATYSAASGIIFFVGFVAIAASSGRGISVLVFWAAVIVEWTWLSVVSAYLYRHVTRASATYIKA